MSQLQMQRKTEILNAITNRMKDDCERLERKIEEMRETNKKIYTTLHEIDELMARSYNIPTEEFTRLRVWAFDTGMTPNAFIAYMRDDYVYTHAVQGSNTEYCDRASEASEGSSSNVEAQSE